MTDERDVPSDVLELGTASIETKGPAQVLADEVGGIFPIGMSID